jgi:hypothetical protein
MFSRFLGDMRGALTTLRRAPLLLGISVGLALVERLPGPLALIGLVATLFATGWAGTQQLWAARLERDEALDTSDIWSTSWQYLGRFFVLGLCYVPVILVTFYALFQNGAFDDAHRHITPAPGARIVTALLLVTLEIVLTFVFPALALSTRRVGEAWSIGLQLLRENWRRDAWYAIAPAVTLQSAYSFIATAERSVALRIAVGCALAAVALLFRVTIVREYARLEPVSGRQPV